MNKPSSILYEEFKQKMLALINSSGLPVFVMELVLENYLTELKLLSQRQYQQDKANYENALAAEQKKSEQEVKGQE